MAFYVPPAPQQTVAIASLRATGELPDNRYWNMVEARRDINPTRFDRYHPAIAVLFKQEKFCDGILSNNKWERQYEKNPIKFVKNNPAWIVKLVKLDEYLEKNPICRPTPPPYCPPMPPAVPEPASALMLGISMIGGFFFRKKLV